MGLYTKAPLAGRRIRKSARCSSLRNMVFRQRPRKALRSALSSILTFRRSKHRRFGRENPHGFRVPGAIAPGPESRALSGAKGRGRTPGDGQSVAAQERKLRDVGADEAFARRRGPAVCNEWLNQKNWRLNIGKSRNPCYKLTAAVDSPPGGTIRDWRAKEANARFSPLVHNL
jgi:hypothetical protein